MATPCPSCRSELKPLRLEGRLAGQVELDLCFGCQGIWFDAYESQQIAPGGIVGLFELIHQHRDDPRLPISPVLQCPRCDKSLLHSQDIVKSGRFNYYRCPAKHGRFVTFGQFMIEKGFVRQLTPLEIDALKARVGVIRCASCGAPVDIRQDSACGHCGSPIAILDPDAVERALNKYRQAEIRRETLDPAGLADAILLTEQARNRRRAEQTAELAGSGGDLISAGVEIIWRLLD